MISPERDLQKLKKAPIKGQKNPKTIIWKTILVKKCS